MGQTQSSARRAPEDDVSPPARSSTTALAPLLDSTSQPLPHDSQTEASQHQWRRRSSRLLLGRQISSTDVPETESSQDGTIETRRTSQNRTIRMFRRAQSSMSDRLPRFRRSASAQTAPNESTESPIADPPTIVDSRPSAQDISAMPSETVTASTPESIPHTHDDNSVHDLELAPLTRHRSSGRPSSLISDRLPSLRPDRLTRTISNTLRRRRSMSSRSNEQIPVLSEILTAAAAATAATLMGGNDPDAVRNARGIGGDEGTLETFLESLQNGRMASALSRSTSLGNGDGRNGQGINFVRLFRFGNTTEDRSGTPESSTSRSTSMNGEAPAEGRMVPIIIVGIRSIQPNGGAEGNSNVPSFIDALAEGPHGAGAGHGEHGDLNSRLPGRFGQRRRASMQSYDNQRHQRSLRSRSPRPFLRSLSPRPLAATPSESGATPYPPPSTPASAGLSAISSGATTPNVPSGLGTGSAGPSRRPSMNRNVTGGEPGVDETMTLPRRNTRRRRLSDSDFTRWGSGSPRRNGVVEPDDTETTSARSWIIYVLGGSYPENHPLLNTPSLFTDQPTYEDMLLLSSLIGPAKPPVASEDEVASAPGLFTIRNGEYPGSLIGLSVDNDDLIAIGAEERCLVCLSDFEAEEQARKLVQCGHFFHKDCIDQWLTTGRNSCPLCRQEGVLKSAPEPSTTPPAAASVPATP